MSESHLDDPRILDLADADESNANYYFPVEKSGETEAQKKPISDIIEEAKEKTNTLRGTVVYAARITETTNNIEVPESNKDEKINFENGVGPLSFINAIHTVNNRYQLFTRFTDQSYNPNEDYFPYIIASPDDLDSARTCTYRFVWNPTLVKWILWVVINDSTSADRLCDFIIEIKKW